MGTRPEHREDRETLLMYPLPPIAGVRQQSRF